MAHIYITLLGFCLLSFSLLFVMVFVRVKAVRKGLRAKDMRPDNENISDFAYRVSRAHANYYENLPILVAITVVAAMNDALHIMQGSALVLLFLRALQTSVHLYSGRMRYAMLRGALFASQVVIQIYWVIALMFIF